MSVQGWKYYNHAMIPDCAPNEEPDLSVIDNGEIWKKSVGGGHHFLLDGQQIGIVGMKPGGGIRLLIAPLILPHSKVTIDAESELECVILHVG